MEITEQNDTDAKLHICHPELPIYHPELDSGSVEEKNVDFEKDIILK